MPIAVIPASVKDNPQTGKQGYDQEKREIALKMYVDGVNFRRIGRFLGVDPQSIANRVHAKVTAINAHHASLPSPPPVSQNDAEAGKGGVIEMDELFNFVGTKKAASVS